MENIKNLIATTFVMLLTVGNMPMQIFAFQEKVNINNGEEICAERVRKICANKRNKKRCYVNLKSHCLKSINN